jgi:hypothetical protein
MDGAAVGLAFAGGVFGDVGQPHQVRGGGAEVALDEVLMDGSDGRASRTDAL